MSRVVLDSSALLALLLEEQGADEVTKAMEDGGALICAVNLAEVAGRLALLGNSPARIREALEPLELEVALVDKDLAFRAGFMAPASKPLGLSMGDRMCLATAEQLGGTALTADRAWLKWKGKAKVVCIR